ncbi:MAG: MBL fold metallo-hydrolase [Clostridium sp.]|uniref:ComEC/Rec2 family competence protein n=1 Tax=Clostridium sp. TaxID=1506 RepID=UPI0025BC3C47|nr:ComEC/Rec2 family competence protein [Clostridium sp.]MCF0147134.1 MBL fold metallo-hydrolase [Clostridium sp.]
MIKKYKLLKKAQNILLLFLLILSIFLLRELIYKKNSYINPNEIKIHYIDVGQGDAILVQVNNKNLLIDSGPRSEKKKLTDYLDSIYISQFDYVIATHPHEDHIGNMSYIISNYNILNFYSPKIESNTTTFENMAEALSRKNIKIKILKANNKTLNLGENTLVEVFSPSLDSYDNLNNYSPIIKIYYGNTSFIFTGDAEENVESEVSNKSFNLKSDVLKLGHHGSSTSTSKNFLEKVKPKITIISVGKDNNYGHPTKETLDKIKNTTVYRTDINGSIIITSDGKTLKSSFK